MTDLSQERLELELALKPEPLTDLREDATWIHAGAVSISKQFPRFSVGLAHPMVRETNFELQRFAIEKRQGWALVLHSGGKPPLYIAGWVTLEDEGRARLWVDRLNSEIRQRLDPVPQWRNEVTKTYSDEGIRSNLQLNRAPLDELTGDEHCWRLGAVEVRRNDALFRVGFGHSVVRGTRFLLQRFSLDEHHGTAIVLVSGGKPPRYFVGWVPLGRELDAVRWVETLNATLRAVSGGVAATTSSDLGAADAISFEIGNENAPDAPYGVEIVTLTKNGHVTYSRKRSGVCASRTGSVATERVLRVIEALHSTTFPAPPQAWFTPGGAMTRITLLPSGDSVYLDYFRALRMEGYRDVVQQLAKLADALRDADAVALGDWQFIPTDAAPRDPA